jgi:hypothetical protein
MNEINLHKILTDRQDDFIFNLQGIENYNSESTRLRFWFDHCKKNIDKIDGDIFEFGVFRGSSLISMALLLKKLGSSKKVYGFDSFGGFPEYHEHDDFKSFSLFPDIFEGDIVDKHNLMVNLISTKDKQILPGNISSSGHFADTSESYVRRKINELELDNIELIVGDFADTVKQFFSDYKGEIFSCNLDCDLYLGYKNTLPYVYDRLVKGGYIHLDEYYSLKFPGARIACAEYFKEKGIEPQKNIVPSHEFERWFVTK